MSQIKDRQLNSQLNKIELLKEERRALLDDNDSLNIKLQEVSAENDQLRRDNQIIDFLQGSDTVYHQEGDDEKMKRMFRRIEELEDLLIEMKQKLSLIHI